MEEFGPLGLFFSAFLAATILPFSSEVALVGAVEMGMHKGDALLYASLGNCLAVMVNFFLGVFFYALMQDKIQASRTGRKAYAIAHKYGYFSLLLSPFPVIGDPITIAAGLIRLNIFYFVLITFALRIGRYYLLLQLL